MAWLVQEAILAVEYTVRVMAEAPVKLHMWDIGGGSWEVTGR